MAAVTDTLGFAIVGTGNVSRYHAEGIAQAPGARLVAVCRADPARAAEAAKQFGVPCEVSYDALLARADVDAVCLCTPSGQHAAQTVAAAKAGKHVLVEKPMALSLADADAMIAACRTAGVALGVTFQRRTEPSYRALRDAAAAGELGRLVLGTTAVPYFRDDRYYQSAAWRGTWAQDGGGALMNQGIHLVDLLVWLMGDVEQVSARSDTLLHSVEVEDAIAVALRFASGALGTIVATTAAAPGFPHRLEIYGTLGSVQLEGDAVVRWEGGGARPAEAAAGSVAAGAGASATGISAAGHVRIVGDFAGAIREGRPPMVPGEEGRRSLAVVLAAYESARTGRPVRP
ncbi:MAG TPA: Gfo/Idh/MocA family oxidoreductase [Vicinamibacteria bacterium]|nr:Gfo/Idh/MocA family oxidoreductase [Vicinamibacteria bacterium]